MQPVIPERQGIICPGGEALPFFGWWRRRLTDLPVNSFFFPFVSLFHKPHGRFQRIVVLTIDDLRWLPFQQHTFLLP